MNVNDKKKQTKYFTGVFLLDCDKWKKIREKDYQN